MWMLLPFMVVLGPIGAVIELIAAFLPMKLFERVFESMTGLF